MYFDLIHPPLPLFISPAPNPSFSQIRLQGFFFLFISLLVHFGVLKPFFCTVLAALELIMYTSWP